MGRVTLKRCSWPRKRSPIVIVAVLSLLALGLVRLFGSSPFQDAHLYDFTLRPTRPHPTRPKEGSSSSSSSSSGRSSQGLLFQNVAPPPAPSPFRRVRDLDVFLYSAVANDREPVPGEVNIILTGFDSTGRGTEDSLTCCVVVTQRGGKLYTGRASVFYRFYVETSLGPVLEFFKNAPSKAKQYSCVVPQLGFEISHVTLTSSTCPDEEADYLPVIFPQPVPQGLAVCAKTAFGKELDPAKLVEWFEVLRLLGVDHIQLMDLHNPEPVQKVFRYYTEMGLLNLLPYELPGPPQGRGLHWDSQVVGQVSHDESLPILDCTQRLRGYSFILGHDMDEVLVPARHNNLKDFFKEQFMTYPDAAALYFYTQFFVEDWGPQNVDSDVFYFRYLNSTRPRNECKKYVYIPSRVEQARTHEVAPRDSYQTYFVPAEEAILHHYRKCPHVWSTCNPPRMTDQSMLRFRGVLEGRLREAQKAAGIYPKL